MNWQELSKFISEHPIFTFGCFILGLALIEALGNVLCALLKR